MKNNIPFLSSEKLLSIIDKAQIIIFVWRNAENWPIEYVSDNISIFGYTPDDFLSGKFKFSEVVHPMDIERIENEVISNSENHIKEFQQEYRIWTKEREIKWVHDRTTIRYDSKGNITHYEGIIIDITEKKEMEQKLQESNDKYHELVSQANSIILRLDKQGVITYANEFAVEFFGFSEEELIGHHVTQTIVPPIESTSRDLINMVDTVLNKPEDYRLNINENIKKNGEKIWCSWSNKEINNEEGEYDGLLSIGNDITALRNTQIALKKSEESYIKLYHDVTERMKELECLYNISKIIEKDEDLDITLQQIVRILPSAWQYPEATVAKIEYKTKSFLSEHYQTAPSYMLADIRIKSEKIGFITLGYLKNPLDCEQGPFLEDEINLLNNIAAQIARLIDKKESEKKYQILFENASDAIFVQGIDDNGDLMNCSEVNKAACDMLNYSREELLQLKPQDVDDKFDSAEIDSLIEELKQGKKIVIESIHISKDGREIPVELSGQIFDFLNQKHLLILARDITERKKAEIKLKESMEKYQQLFDNVSDAIYVHEINEKGELTSFTEVNHAACNMLNYSREELFQLEPQDLGGSNYSQEQLRAIVERLRLGEKIVYEAIHISKDKRRIPVEQSSQMFEYLDKQIVLTIARDITDRKKHEQLVEDRYRETLELSQLKSNIILWVFTELKSPLTSMFFQYLEYKKLEVSNQEQIFIEKTRLDSTLDQLSHMIEKVDEFIDISRLESFNLNLHKEEIEVIALIKSVLKNLDSILIKKNIDISLSGNSPLIELDRISIEHVLLTLILYMIDRTKENASISITSSDSFEGVKGFLRISLRSTELISPSSLVSYNLAYIKICENIIKKHNGILLIDQGEQQQAFLIEILLPMPENRQT